MKRIPAGAALLVLALALTALPAARPPETPLEKKVRAQTDKLTPGLIDIRRDIHAHPELGMQETRTSALVADYFRKLGLEVRTGFAKTGVLGILKGGKPGPVVAFRGDISAATIVLAKTFTNSGSSVQVAESGLFNDTAALTNGLFARKNFTAITVGNGASLTVQWTVNIGGTQFNLAQ